MSKAEIISEIPKLSHVDRREILRRIFEVEGNMPPDGLIADTWEKLGPAPDVDYDQL